MDTLILQLIMSRMGGGGGNPALAAMLGQGNGGAPNPQELLAQMAGNADPSTAAMLQQLAEQQRKLADEAAIVEADAKVIERPYDDERAAAAEANRQAVANICAELEHLRGRMDDLAHALGACPSCWGSDPDCRICRGRGSSGYSMPDKSLFAKFVLPAIRMLRAHEPQNNGFGHAKPEPANHIATV